MAHNIIFVYLLLYSRLLVVLCDPMEDVKGIVVVITGAAQGIGYQTANNFIKNGAKKTILLDINECKGIEAYNNLASKYGKEKVEFIKCDVTKDLGWTYDYLIRKFNKIDLLINNAGIDNENSVKKTVAVNVIAVMEWTRIFLEHMRIDKNGKGGTIINVSSVYGYQIDEYFPIYKGTKFAIYGFSRSLGYEKNFKKSGVRIITVCPGYTVTNLAKVQGEISPEFERNIYEKGLWQLPEVVGEAMVEIYKKARSGTAWKIATGKLEELA